MKRKREQPPDVPPGGGEPEGDGGPYLNYLGHGRLPHPLPLLYRYNNLLLAVKKRKLLTVKKRKLLAVKKRKAAFV